MKAVATHLAWPDGAEQIPEVWENRGWYYLPDEIRTHGGPKTFGRSSKGANEATKWLNGRLKRALSKHQWRVPTTVLPKQDSLDSYDGHDGLVAKWLHPVFGTIVLSASVNRYSTSNDRVVLGLQYHPLVNVLADRTLLDSDKHLSPAPQRYTKVENCGDSGEVEKLLVEWRADPVAVAQRYFGNEKVWALLKPPNLANLPFTADEKSTVERDGVPIMTKADKYTMFAMRNEAESVLMSAKTREALEVLEQALKYWDVDFRIEYAWGGRNYNDRQLHGFTIGIEKKLGVPGREESHKVNVNESGTTVTCGYIRSDEKYLEYKKRQALDFFQGIDEFVDVEFERNE